MNPGVAVASILISIALVLVTLLQAKGTSTGMFQSSASPFRTRRGFEKLLFRGTIALAFVYVAISLLNFRLF